MIPGFTSTGSKRPEALFGDPAAQPAHMSRAEGCRVWGVDGRVYLDTIMALGAVGLGYAHPNVVAAAERAIRDGTVGSLAPALEAEVADRVRAAFPMAEGVRFFKTGAEVAAAAVRIARVVTGRDHVVRCGYHGWLDWCSRGAGVPSVVAELTTAVPFNDPGALEAAVERAPTAAIVLEPVVEALPSPAWLERARALASRAGAVLVFDEIKTAFRLARGGVAERYGIVPDLMILGKAMGNGFPIAAVGGRRDVMDGAAKTWISSTLATEYVSLAACRAVLEIYQDRDVPRHLERVGTMLFDGMRRLARAHTSVIADVRGIPQMSFFTWKTEEHGARVAREMAERGVLFKRNAYNFVSWAHTEELVGTVLDRLEDSLHEVVRAC